VQEWTIRRGTGSDAEAVARLVRASREATMPWFPDLHTPEEDLVYFGSALSRARAYVAVLPDPDPGHDSVVGVAVVDPDEDLLAHLYLHPSVLRRGLGTALLDLARAEHRGPLELWCFADNVAGLAFYAAQGAQEVRRTDGAGNDEGLPDVLLRLPYPG
jgi:GNAT superfamily N-acetyltransferase